MKTIEKIIEQRGGLTALKRDYIRIENNPYMPLVIDWLGNNSRGWNFISVSHTYIQNGDIMRDPEIVFLITDNDWLPVSYRNDSIGAYSEAVIVDDGEVRSIPPPVLKDLQIFARTWDRNISDQGYIEAFVANK